MSKVKIISLVLGGFVVGVFISLYILVFVDKDVKLGLLIDELCIFVEVYSVIK